MPAIAAQDLTKTFHITQKDPGVRGAIKAVFQPHHTTKTAVNKVNFTINAGEMVGYIGVNGAGKSTTIKMLTGVLQPTSGQVRVLGRDPHRERVANARQIGVVFGQRTQLWWDLALIESLDMVAKIYEVPTDRYKQLLKQFADVLDLNELLHVPIRQMSLGQKMRAELAATLIHEPQVVYLDEPTIGLDLLVKERIRQFIHDQNTQKGTTVVLTTHDLGDIEELCSRVMIIDNGELIYDGPLSLIKDRFGKYREIKFDTTGFEGVVNLPAGAQMIEQGECSLVVRFDRTLASASQVAASVMSQVDVRDFSLSEPGLAMIIKQIYQGALNKTEAKEI